LIGFVLGVGVSRVAELGSSLGGAEKVSTPSSWWVAVMVGGRLESGSDTIKLDFLRNGLLDPIGSSADMMAATKTTTTTTRRRRKKKRRTVKIR
jgi:hypothetical protein